MKRLVDDDWALAGVVAAALAEEGFEVAHDGNAGRCRARHRGLAFVRTVAAAAQSC